ncbi:uncharacterized protein PAC_02367 [Phialocephala subalpina]|uniref:BTB domain-containing protein n=1 Tax=Phialocephala subalpina TaxID=576137 RepID=A0A1L7WI99_9HELO|nr:uncharacterized protein PAC_02367 [Phialocephala subalpina]
MSKIIVDPNHDIVLRLNGYDLLVSSKVLSLASPVFEAMFKPHFKEGVEHHLQLGEPLIIPLPEDDLEATTLFCQITHHRSRDLPRTPSPLCLENLAIFCNKYICAGPVASYGILWIQRHSGSQSIEDFSRLLLLAYILDLPESFAAVSREMLLLKSGLFTSLWVVDNHPVTHGDLLGEFNKRKRALFKDLQKGIIGLASRMATYDCENVTKANGRYLHSLKKCGLFPCEDSFEAQSFSTIIEKASQFQSYRVERCGVRCNCYELKDMDLKVELQQGIEKCE